MFLGTWGSVISPGLMFNPQIASIAYKAGEIPTADSMIVIMQEAIPAALGILIASLILAAISMLLKEGVGSVKEETETDREMANFRINPIMAIIPVIPALPPRHRVKAGRVASDENVLGSGLHADRHGAWHGGRSYS